MNNNLAIDDIKLSSFDASNNPSNLSVLPKDNSNLLFNQLDILEEFNQYKFLRPMKKKMYIILNRLNNSDNKHNKNSKRNKKLFKKVNKIAVNIDLINDMPVGNAIIAEDMIIQSKNALFEGILDKYNCFQNSISLKTYNLTSRRYCRCSTTNVAWFK